MTLEREVDPALRAMLMANQPFEYAHLIKFERPSRPDNTTGLPSTSSVRYTHLTDGSRNINFDDGSKTSTGVPNGVQAYLANKVLKVSEVSESVEVKASNFSITLDGNGLGADTGLTNVVVTAIAGDRYDIEIVDKNIDPIDLGFREGDKIEIYGGNFNVTLNIEVFRDNNIIRTTKIDDNLNVGAFSNIGLRMASEEIKSILLDKTLPEYASFVNREVFIYKVYEQNGVTVGKPLLLFKGIISNVSFDDNDNGIVVQWGLTSHWGDFAQVKGRITSDDFHRALDQNGNPQPLSALKPEYAYDKGFIHSETSLNLLAKYSVQVEKQNIKSKKGFFGIGAKVKVKKYYESESRFTELDFQLQAKAIPLHYGVRITEGFPVFADTLKNDSSTVYVIYVLGEGPFGAIYDVIVDGKTLICSNKGDLDARSAQTATDTVDIVCRGRADRGDVLGGSNFTNPNAAAIPYYTYGDNDHDYTNSRDGVYSNLVKNISYRPYVPSTVPAAAENTGKGIIDGETITLTTPIDMTLDFFSGREDQAASSQLVELSKASAFKVQNDYWTGSNTAEYWGPNHILADTAYVLAKFKISEGETSIPSLEFIVKSKVINCYNYDYSYAKFDRTNENPDNFNLGDYVNLFQADTNTSLNSNIQIIDKWAFVDEDGVIQTRFRYSETPSLGYVDGVPTITRFYMQNGSGQNWSMQTYNFVEHEGTVGAEMTQEVTPINNAGIYTIPVNFNIPVNPVLSIPNIPFLFSGPINGGANVETVYRFDRMELIQQ